MERVEGTILRASTPQEAMPSPEQFKSLSSSLVDTLVELHQLDYKAIGLGDLGNPEGYIERQVVGWSKRYQKAKTQEVKEMEPPLGSMRISQSHTLLALFTTTSSMII